MALNHSSTVNFLQFFSARKESHFSYGFVIGAIKGKLFPMKLRFRYPLRLAFSLVLNLIMHVCSVAQCKVGKECAFTKEIKRLPNQEEKVRGL